MSQSIAYSECKKRLNLYIIFYKSLSQTEDICWGARSQMLRTTNFAVSFMHLRLRRKRKEDGMKSNNGLTDPPQPGLGGKAAVLFPLMDEETEAWREALSTQNWPPRTHLGLHWLQQGEQQRLLCQERGDNLGKTWITGPPQRSPALSREIL